MSSQASCAELGGTDKNGDTALQVAARCGHAEFCKVLLAAGAEVGAKANYGITALHLAENWRHAEVASLLRDAA